MKIKSFYLLALMLCSITIKLNAQTEPAVADSSVSTPAVDTSKNIKLKPPSNFIKINLTGLILKNYSLQYERVLTKSISLAVAFRTMPVSTIPFKNQIIKIVGTGDPNTKETIENLRLGNFAITPEIRFYLSKKGYGRGFYIAPFYRYAKFTVNNMPFTYENISHDQSKINLSGNFTANTGGILLGVQKAIGKHICLDWWLLGPHYGSGNGNFSGTPNQPLTQEEQDDLRQQLETLDIPLINKTVNVSANSASMKLDGPWAGIRSGLSIGVRF